MAQSLGKGGLRWAACLLACFLDGLGWAWLGLAGRMAQSLGRGGLTWVSGWLGVALSGPAARACWLPGLAGLV